MQPGHSVKCNLGSKNIIVYDSAGLTGNKIHVTVYVYAAVIDSSGIGAVGVPFPGAAAEMTLHSCQNASFW